MFSWEPLGLVALALWGGLELASTGTGTGVTSSRVVSGPVERVGFVVAEVGWSEADGTIHNI